MNDIEEKVSLKLSKIAFFFFESYGMPIELFQELYKKDNTTIYDAILFIESFSKRHPNILS